MPQKQPAVGSIVVLAGLAGKTTQVSAFEQRCNKCVFRKKKLTYCMMLACNAEERNDKVFVYFKE